MLRSQAQQCGFGEDVAVIRNMQIGIAYPVGRNVIRVRCADHQDAAGTHQSPHGAQEQPRVLVMLDDVVGHHGVIRCFERRGIGVGGYEGIVSVHVSEAVLAQERHVQTRAAAVVQNAVGAKHPLTHERL